MEQWNDVVDLLAELADGDLRAGEDMSAPCLLAFGGDELHFTAFLRPFAKGEYRAPIIELLALSAPLGSDRLAFAVSARAWSLEDPVPPVTEAADLRQRVLLIELVDGSGATVEHTSVLLPFEEATTGAGITWGPRQVLGGSEGWISAVLQQAVSKPLLAGMAGTDAKVAAQAERVERLGHQIFLGPGAAARCGRAPAPLGPR